jgi:hypothetical protein
MAWTKLSDDFYRHRKTRGMSDAARALWLTAASWCGENNDTEGSIPPAGQAVLAAVLGWTDKKLVSTAQELVERDLWEDDGDVGYRFNNWLEYNPTKAEAETLHAARSEAGRRGGLAKALAIATANALANSYPGPGPVPGPTKKNDSYEGKETHRVVGEGQLVSAKTVAENGKSTAQNGHLVELPSSDLELLR